MFLSVMAVNFYCILGENATQLEQMNYQNLQNAPGGQYAQYSPGSALRGGPQPYGAPPGKQVSAVVCTT